MLEIRKEHMTNLKYNDINTNRGIFPDNNGVFFPKNGNLQFFSFLILENINKCSKSYSSVWIEKQHINELKYNYINTNWGIFPDNNGVFSPKNRNLQFFSFLKLENIIQMF